MDIINILPDSVANQIAAGEVVDRPAGAVKELLENAMDAGATQIDLVVKDAGRTLIQVIDNGCGMSESDARLCFERHATSKIHRADDLFAIHTMGFRGEALASIAAIAQVELHTRQMGSELGTEVVIEGAKIISQQPLSCPTGTSLSVKNLFFNVPARRNFLKKDSVEMSHIEEVLRRVALVHPDIAFSLTSNGKTVYDLKAGNMLQRICGIFGQSYNERLYAVEEATDLVKIKGYVCKPEHCRKTRGEQYLFVNGRFIKHPALNAAVEKAYIDLVPERTYPSYFIGLQVDPSRIDINIHPAKTEVKFVDEQALFSILRAAVKRSLGQFSLATELRFDTPEEFNIGPAPQGYTPQQPQLRYQPDYNPFRPQPSQTSLAFSFPDPPPHSPTPSASTQATDEGDLRLKASSPSCLQIQERYIATALRSGIALIDQQRAHERVIYDRLMAQLESHTPDAQTMLFPVTCSFSASDSEMLTELLPDLKAYGFDIAPRGGTTFVLSAAPSDIKTSDLQSVLDQLLSDYRGSTMQRYNNARQSISASLARQMAVKAGTRLGQEQMQQLVADLFACPMAGTSPSGKKTITIVHPSELLK
ncbi:MAG: DNA mismatch repair endonuclease MutL [Bacteroidales bacterium]|nr:DNA mismatch repair endonuclease MutL [Bacteroidales bacterium]